MTDAGVEHVSGMFHLGDASVVRENILLKMKMLKGRFLYIRSSPFDAVENILPIIWITIR